jgi:sulfonate dioxygenase
MTVQLLYGDNRVTAHTTISDYVNDEQVSLRKGLRITTMDEVPVGANGMKSEWE